MDKYSNYHTLLSGDKYCQISLDQNQFSRRQSFFFHVLNVEEPWPFLTDTKILQTQKSPKMSVSRYFSVLTILSYIPYIEYVFFDDNDVKIFLEQNYPRLIKTYDKLNVGAYKADLFRALYGYKSGCVYFDCKNILFMSLSSLFMHQRIFVKDRPQGYIYNGIFYVKSKDPIMHEYILLMITNIHSSRYTNDSLSITGPGALGKCVIDKNECLLVHTDTKKNEWWQGVIKHNNKIIIKPSYQGYYEENNYIHTSHYGIMWENRMVYTEPIISINSELVKHIAWINLDRSHSRRDNMIKVLDKINIPNTRISAVDGNFIDPSEHKHRNLTKYEIACCMSHINAVTYLATLDGNYFLIFEDDMDINNVILFNESIDDIINNVPQDLADFDILLLSKIYIEPLPDTYTSWNQQYNEGNHIASTLAYIITKKGIEKLMDTIKTYKSSATNLLLEESDVFMYKYVKTIVYKLNFIAHTCESSTIHNDHESWHKKVADFQLNQINSDIIV